MCTEIVIAVAAIVQAAFAIVLVLVYVRKQTSIMQEQSRTSERQTDTMQEQSRISERQSLIGELGYQFSKYVQLSVEFFEEHSLVMSRKNLFNSMEDNLAVEVEKLILQYHDRGDFISRINEFRDKQGGIYAEHQKRIDERLTPHLDIQTQKLDKQEKIVEDLYKQIREMKQE